MDENSKAIETIERLMHDEGGAPVPEQVQARASEHLAALRERMDSYDENMEHGRGRILSMRLAAVAVALAVVALAAYFVIPGPGTSIAFADVLKKFENYPYSHVTTTISGGRSQSYNVTSLSPSVRREEFPDGIVRVFNLQADLTLDGQPVKGVVLLTVSDKYASQEVWYEDISERVGDGFMSLLRRMQEGNEALGVEKIDGRKAYGFHKVEGNDDITVWVDVETQLPARIEIVRLKSGDKLIESDFEFNIEVDPAMFSTDPPEGVEFQKVEHKTPVVNQEPVEELPFRPYAYTQDIIRDGKLVGSMHVIHPNLTQRRETRSGGRILVFDLSEGKVLTLNPEKKVAKVDTFPGGQKVCDLINSVRRWYQAKDEDLGEKVIDGRLAYGFRHVQPYNEFTAWVDKETNLPVYVEIYHPSRNQTLISKDFDWNVQINPEDFSTEIPEGYTEKEDSWLSSLLGIFK